MTEVTLLRGGYVLTLDDELGEIPDADVLLIDGGIAEVGVDLQAPEGADEVDCRGMLVMPGFIDTHQHLWNSFFRGLTTGVGERAYFPVKRRLAALVTADDTAAATLAALWESAASGITSVVDWHHNLRSPDYAEATAAAHRVSGLRTRLAYGNPDAWDATRTADLDDLERWASAGVGPLSDLGLAVRGPTRSEPAVLAAEWEAAARLGLPMTMHMGGRRSDVDRYADLRAMDSAGLLVPALQVVHAVDADEEELRLLAHRGVSISLSPATELGSMGAPPIVAALDAGVQLSLSTDSLALPARADMFEQMRTVVRLGNARGGAPVTPRTALSLATREGARDLGWDHVVGRVRPGLRADIVVVDARRLGFAVALDPVLSLVMACGVEDVHHVLVDGRWVKRGGVDLTGLDAARARSHAALRALLARAGWAVGGTGEGDVAVAGQGTE
ncbi:amidohydrolase family protein [Microcella humidisoli]|uniref:Amidohydrolase family protein n=1 Tax=Microcella humidisoli TaxID=2963406 RepID=A0ABY5FXY7_9MICO|nr:amidohydrolase family protein [Microcella humidisoli]UTT62807.1 amidohydrolase family protein [Microcella humidisoli]